MPGAFDFAEHRNPLGGIFGDKDCHLGVFQKSAVDEFLPNEILHISSLSCPRRGLSPPAEE